MKEIISDIASLSVMFRCDGLDRQEGCGRGTRGVEVGVRVFSVVVDFEKRSAKALEKGSA